MISPWLIHSLYQIAKLLSFYTPNNKHPTSLFELYHCIENGRSAYNAERRIVDQLDEEWDLNRSDTGYTLFYSGGETVQIWIEASDNDEQVQIGIGGEGNEIFYAVVMNNGRIYPYFFNARLVEDDTHRALLQLLNTDIFHNQILDEKETLEKLPSYALH